MERKVRRRSKRAIHLDKDVVRRGVESGVAEYEKV